MFTFIDNMNNQIWIFIIILRPFQIQVDCDKIMLNNRLSIRFQWYFVGLKWFTTIRQERKKKKQHDYPSNKRKSIFISTYQLTMMKEISPKR